MDARETREARKAELAGRTGRSQRRLFGRGPRWQTRGVKLVAHSPGDGDIVAQLAACLEDVRAQLHAEQLSPSDVSEVTVLSTDFPSARQLAGSLARWLRQAGARERVVFVAVQELAVPGTVIELEVSASRTTLISGQAPPESPPPKPVPDHLRAAVRAELDALVRGKRPDQLVWVEQYGDDGATLVAQPEDIWEHPDSHTYRYDNGGWSIEVPLWTLTECPSDLTAQIEIDPSGRATLYDVHVM